MSELQVIGQIENTHLIKTRNGIRIAMERMPVDWIWSNKEVKEFKKLWKEDKPLREIAFELDKDEFDCLPMVFELLYLEEIKPRENWNIW
ncbi:hypothetical protein [Niallia sp. RD1]|uniref:hypothetical protein n=1 Tax=Niallia sp. RD1 TaxID=2962858 RepID=UPI0020C19FEE|nr:hypothetical protein [Niallia sp. RD1]UTI41093.1 hypothetical protein NKG37_19855 [Niallia sp. RD1]